MGRPAEPWTDADRVRRDRILASAEARAISRKALGEAVGLKGPAAQVRLHRWAKGQAHLPPAQLTAMEAFLERCGGGTDPTGDEATPAAVLEQTARDLQALAGAVPDGEADELRALARRHRRTAVGGVLRIALTDKSSHVRLRAWELILERSDGKAVQQLVDLTPKPPATADELVAAIQKAIDQVEQKPADPVAVPDAPAA